MFTDGSGSFIFTMRSYIFRLVIKPSLGYCLKKNMFEEFYVYSIMFSCLLIAVNYNFLSFLVLLYIYI